MNDSLPDDLAKLQARFDHWRNTRKTRSPIPEDLLQAARALLDRYSISAICRACHLPREKSAVSASEKKKLTPANTKTPAPAINGVSSMRGAWRKRWRVKRKNGGLQRDASQ